MTARELLQTGTRLLQHKVAAPQVEAKVLLLLAAGLKEVELLASPERVIADKEEKKYRRLIQRRLSGVPLAYIVGRKEFWSMSLRVETGVLIPRPESELLVEKTLDLAAGPRATIVDIGTGSGNIALALAKELPAARVVATDVSIRALRVAILNAHEQGLENVTFVRGSLFSALSGLGLEAGCDFIVCNPPYVSASEWRTLPREIRDHEPRRAFLGGKTGLEFVRRLIKGSPAYLKPGGHLLFEVGYGQAEAATALLGPDWTGVRSSVDLRGIARVIAAQKSVEPPVSIAPAG
jgi:release factor glutamine methyltransferase